ncbi:hypothetical protein A2U01_0019367, partial [Trifolium medium]|nr:hypothetical protein [Trifolium medium]MCH98365.1 hypothetical protein [Trifolium medium]
TLLTSSLTNTVVPPPHPMKSIADWLKAVKQAKIISKSELRFVDGLLPAPTNSIPAVMTQ